MSLTFISGGCRSGKSAYAQALAEKALRGGHALFVATAYVLDEEMRNRVEAHKAARGARWRTYEMASGSAAALAGHIAEAAQGADVLLFDCLTLWVSACMEQHNPDSRNARQKPEQALQRFADDCAGLLHTLQSLPCPVLLVSNEAGMGLVPENAESRLFRDYAGIANQLAAARADTAVFMVSGLPLALKGQLPG
jgi:adenosylcobinamide kinase/adenosylcobinamide-phosphate guanylyltransferase